MKRGQKSGKTHAREDLSEHFAIKPKATEPSGPSRQNDALRRLQLSPSDPRWELDPKRYRWHPFDPRDGLPPGVNWLCWYCAEFCDNEGKLLASVALSFICHAECYADGDTIAPKRATVDST